MNRFPRASAFLLLAALLLTSACGGSADAEPAPSPEIRIPEESSPSPTQEAQAEPSPVTELILTAEVADDGAVTLTWTEDGSGFYRVWRINPYTAQRTLAAELESGGGETASFTDAADGTDFYRVYAVQSYSGSSAADAGDVFHDARIRVRNGFVTEFGIMRYYENNESVTDTVIRGLQFGPDGVYTSGNAELDEYVTQLLRETVPDDMDPVEKLRILYDWVIGRSTYEAVRFITEYDDAGWEPEAALKLFRNGYGNCFSYAAGVCMLARAVGLEAHCVVGSCFQATEWVDHSWVEITLDGVLYYCDPEMEGVFSAKRDYGWDLFMKQYGDEGPTDYQIWKVF